MSHIALEDAETFLEQPYLPMSLLPTPLHPMRQLTRHFLKDNKHINLFIKRDDLTGIGGGVKSSPCPPCLSLYLSISLSLYLSICLSICVPLTCCFLNLFKSIIYMYTSL